VTVTKFVFSRRIFTEVPQYKISRKNVQWEPGLYMWTDGQARRNLISNFYPVMDVIFFILGDSPTSEFYAPTFRNTIFRLRRWCKQEGSPTSECYAPTFRNTFFRFRRWCKQEGSSASEFYAPTFRNTLFRFYRCCKQEDLSAHKTYVGGADRVFRNAGI
jgi:hypothetical protein